MPLRELDRVEIPLDPNFTVVMPQKGEAVGAPATDRILRPSVQKQEKRDQNLLAGGADGADCVEKPPAKRARSRKTKAEIESELDQVKAHAARTENNLRRCVRKLTDQNENLRKECLKLKTELSQQPEADDDEWIRNTVFDFRLECQRWAEDYAHAGTLTESPVNPRRVAYVKLNRLLAELVYCVIERPLIGILTESAWQAVLEKSQIDGQLCEWIRDTIQALKPIVRKRKLCCADLPSERAKSCKICSRTRSFLDGDAKGYLNFTDERRYNKCVKELRSIVDRAREVSLQLWAQGTRVGCVWEQEKLAETDFEIGLNDMVPHDCMTIAQLDKTLDSKPVSLVVEPAIVTYITGNDAMKPKRKVWGKAMVLVDGWEEALSQKLAPTMGIKDKETPNIQPTIEGSGRAATSDKAEIIQSAPQDVEEISAPTKPSETTLKEAGNVDTTRTPNKFEQKDVTDSGPETKPAGFTQQDSGIADAAADLLETTPKDVRNVDSAKMPLQPAAEGATSATVDARPNTVTQYNSDVVHIAAESDDGLKGASFTKHGE